jgi:CheY-like chemotaxis protein/two-component sensor histidine kinase
VNGARRDLHGEDVERLAELGRMAGELFHDLAGVAALLRGSAELAQDEVGRGRDAAAEVRSVTEHARYLERMVVDVFEEVRGAHPGAEVRFEPVREVEAVINRWTPLAGNRSISLRQSLDPAVSVAGRSTFFSRAVRNLLDNAGRHARNRVEIRLAQEKDERGEWVTVSVEDDGPGVDRDVGARLFTPFAHGGHGGTGFGLSFVRWAAERLGGRVSYQRGCRLDGACFVLCVPAAPPHVRPRYTASAPPGSLRGVGVVVVDDDERLLTLYRRIFERFGAAFTGLQAMGDERDEALAERVLGARPDVVLVDRRLGGTCGEEVCARILRCDPDLLGRTAILTGGGGDVDLPGVPVLEKTMDVPVLVERVASMARAPRFDR